MSFSHFVLNLRRLLGCVLLAISAVAGYGMLLAIVVWSGVWLPGGLYIPFDITIPITPYEQFWTRSDPVFRVYESAIVTISAFVPGLVFTDEGPVHLKPEALQAVSFLVFATSFVFAVRSLHRESRS